MKRLTLDELKRELKDKYDDDLYVRATDIDPHSEIKTRCSIDPLFDEETGKFVATKEEAERLIEKYDLCGEAIELPFQGYGKWGIEYPGLQVRSTSCFSDDLQAFQKYIYVLKGEFVCFSYDGEIVKPSRVVKIWERQEDGSYIEIN